MSDDIGTALVNMAVAKAKGYTSGATTSKGILINREPPITAGWCGNDNCEHVTHKQRRSAQAAAEKRSK